MTTAAPVPRWSRAGAVVLALAVLAGCGASLPSPRLGPNRADAYVEVPYPPPAARVEFVPPRPPGAVWIDGQWNWDGSRWHWDAGGWVAAPAGAYFAPWAVTYRADGVLLFAAARWRDVADGHDVTTPPLIAAAARSEPGE